MHTISFGPCSSLRVKKMVCPLYIDGENKPHRTKKLPTLAQIANQLQRGDSNEMCLILGQVLLYNAMLFFSLLEVYLKRKGCQVKFS